MPSYTTSLRLVQPATGEYSGTWGTEVNTGLTALVDASIAGTTSITMTAANFTLTTANGASDQSRAMFLVLGGTPGASYAVIVPSVSKLYFVTNNTGFAQTVRTSGTGISVPNGASMTLRCDGTNVVVAQNYFASMTLGSALPTGSGGTGSTSTTYCSLTTNVTGTLPVANGGTGAATFTSNNVLLGNGTSAFQAVAPGTNGNVLTSNGTTWQSSAPSVGVATISFGTTGLTPSTATNGAVNVAGTLATANGGTGLTSFTANGVVYASSTSALVTGSGLTFDGTNFATTGTASATKLIPTGGAATGNGMYLPEANTLAWSNNGAESMRLDSSGNLGVGTTSPGAKLHINSGASNEVARFEGTGEPFISLYDNGFRNFYLFDTTEIRMWGQANKAMVFATNNTERARITSGGDLLVGTTTSLTNSANRLAVTGSRGIDAQSTGGATSQVGTLWNNAATGDNVFLQFGTEGTYTSRGGIDYNRAGGLVRYNTTSDYRAKDILGPVENPGATIDALKVYEGRMKGATQSRPMLVAHEAQEHLPYAVSGVKDEENEDGTPKFQQMDHASLVPLLIAEIQQLRARVAVLEKA
jgi:hypothetical protein